MRLNVEYDENTGNYEHDVALKQLKKGDCFALLYNVNLFYHGSYNEILQAIELGKIPIAMIVEVNGMYSNSHGKNDHDIRIPCVYLDGSLTWIERDVRVVPIHVNAKINEHSLPH